MLNRRFTFSGQIIWTLRFRVSHDLPARNKVLASAKPWSEIGMRLGCRMAALDVVWPIG